VPVSPKKEELSAATVTGTVSETRVQTEMVNEVFPSNVVTEVSVIPAGNLLDLSPIPMAGVFHKCWHTCEIQCIRSQVNCCHIG
jgi:hypothetical protein